MKKRTYTESEVKEVAKQLAKRRLVCYAVGGSVLALGAIAAVTWKVMKTMSAENAWNSVDWNIDEDFSLL